MTKRQLQITLAALAVSVLAASRLTAHGDITYISRIGKVVAEGHLNPYQYFFTTPALVKELYGLTYPPLTYLFFGGIMAIGRIFGLFAAAPTAWSISVTDIFFIRLWYTPFVFLIGWVARRFYEEFIHPDDDVGNARLVQVLATACPITLFVAFCFGQFDVLPAALLFLGVYLLCRGRVLYGMLAVFGGILLKNFPIVYLVVALPVLLAAYGPKRTLGSLVVCVLLCGLLFYLPFRGPGMDGSFLAFQHMNYDVLTWGSGVLKTSVTNQLLVVLAVVSMVLATVKTPLETWQKLVLLYAFSLAAVLGPRFWMPQYIAWFGPVVVLTFLVGLELSSALAGALYLMTVGAYLVAVPALFPHNVDVQLFVNTGIALPDTPALDVLSRNRELLWTAITVLIFLTPALPTLRFFAPAWFASLVPPRRISIRTQLAATAALSGVLYFGWIGVHAVTVVQHHLHKKALAAQTQSPPRK
jgi:hypothetical protein